MKRIMVSLVALVFALSLAACGQTKTGTWRMESYDTQDEQSATFRLFADMELKNDGTFTISGYTAPASTPATADSDPKKMKEYVNGTYTSDGSELRFTAKQLNEGYGLKDMEESVDFTGSIKDDGKLYCEISGHSVIFVKQ